MQSQDQSHAAAQRLTRAGSRKSQASLSFTPAAGSVQPDSPALSQEQQLHINCIKTLELLESLGTTFGDFLVAVCYGSSTLRPLESVQNARKSLYESNCLQTLLDNSYCAPRPPCGSGPRPVAGSKTIQRFVCSTIQNIFTSELAAFSEDYRLSDRQLANTDYLETITSDSLHTRGVESCPNLYSMLAALTGQPPAEEEFVEDIEEEDDSIGVTQIGPRPPIEKHPHLNIVFQVTSMAFRLNCHRNTLQKVLTTYMMAKHTSKSVIDILHQAGITMSYSWMRRASSNLSADIHNQMILAARSGPFGAVHNNVRFKHPVQSQRGDNQTVTDNGTAMTLIVFPKSAQALENPEDFQPFYQELKQKRLDNTAPQLSWKDLVVPAHQKLNRTSSIFDILDMFEMIPELSQSKIWKSDRLKRPSGPQQLPHGPEHRLKQFMLPTTNIDESTYSGNSQVIPDVMKHLELDTGAEYIRLTLERLVLWVGDQMTVQRCRKVQNFRRESINGFHRWESLIFIFGGFHAIMALGHSILEGFRGSSVGATFGADMILLSRTGLQKLAGKKWLDFHTVDEFLLHEAEAHFGGLFMHLTNSETGADISSWLEKHDVTDMYNLAETCLTNHASSGALAVDKSGDQMRQLVIKHQRELLLYYSVRRAYKHGDVDRIEALLPELLFFYLGSGNSNYAEEVFEFLQLLKHETTPAVRAAILKHGLVVNRAGRADSFYPIDQCQEFNNAGIRNYGPPPQSSSWAQIAERSSLIPHLMNVVEHVEGAIGGITYSHIHKSPKHEMDIQALIQAHRKHAIHQVVAGRTLSPYDIAKDARRNQQTDI